MGSGGQTQSTQLPKWAQPYAKQGVEGLFNQFLPGGQPGTYPGPPQQVAPLSQDQQLAFAAARGLVGGVPGMYAPYTAGTPYPTGPAYDPGAPYVAGSAYTNDPYAAADPNKMNQYLEPYMQAAERGLISQYQNAIAPDILSRAVQSGNLGGSGHQQATAKAQEALATGLGDMRAKIYEPAYEAAQNRGLAAYEGAQGRNLAGYEGQQGRVLSGYEGEKARGLSGYEAAQNRALSAFSDAQNRGLAATQGEVQAQLAANQSLLGAGGQEQQQAQNVLDTLYGNQYRTSMWPYDIYSKLAGNFGGLMGNQSVAKVSGGK